MNKAKEINRILNMSDEEVLAEEARNKEIEDAFNSAKDDINDGGIFSDDQIGALTDMLDRIREAVLCQNR